MVQWHKAIAGVLVLDKGTVSRRGTPLLARISTTQEGTGGHGEQWPGAAASTGRR